MFMDAHLPGEAYATHWRSSSIRSHFLVYAGLRPPASDSAAGRGAAIPRRREEPLDSLDQQAPPFGHLLLAREYRKRTVTQRGSRRPSPRLERWEYHRGPRLPRYVGRGQIRWPARKAKPARRRPWPPERSQIFPNRARRTGTQALPEAVPRPR